MAKTSGNGGTFSDRMLKEAAFDAYLRIAMHKHSLPANVLETDSRKLSDIELDAALSVVKDLAHLPPG